MQVCLFSDNGINMILMVIMECLLAFIKTRSSLLLSREKSQFNPYMVALGI